MVEAVEGHHLQSYLVVAIQALPLLLVLLVLLVLQVVLQVPNLTMSLKYSLKVLKSTKINMD